MAVLGDGPVRPAPSQASVAEAASALDRRSSRSRGRRRPPVPGRSPRITPCPTSPIHRSPVAWSMRIRHGLRRPVSQISPAGALRSDERVVVRDPVGRVGVRGEITSMRRILASSVSRSRPGVERVAATAAVAGRDVQVAIRPERQPAAVVVAELVGHDEQPLLAVGDGPVRVVRIGPERGDDLVARPSPV